MNTKTGPTVLDMKEYVNTLTDEQLKSMKTILKTEIETRAQKLKYNMHPGDTVMVADGKKVNGQGIVVKINRTRCHVRMTNDGRTWDVPLTMIKTV